MDARNYEDTLEQVKSGDFVYLDPPFAVANRRVFSQYSSATFGLSDLEALAGWLDTINERRATFVVSYADCSEVRQLFSKWPRRRVRTRRCIAGFVGDRRNAYELIFTNTARNTTSSRSR